MQPQLEILPGKPEVGGAQGQSSSQPPFEEVVIVHLDSLLGLALRLARGDRVLAEDLVQETSLQAFKSYKTLRCKEKIRAWLFKILVNTYIDEFNRQSRERPVVDVELTEVLLESSKAAPVVTPEDELFEDLLDTELQQALDKVPVEFRTVVWLADVEELSHREISEVIDRPLGTVASRLYRGHNLLRRHLKEYARQRRLIEK